MTDFDRRIKARNSCGKRAESAAFLPGYFRVCLSPISRWRDVLCDTRWENQRTKWIIDLFNILQKAKTGNQKTGGWYNWWQTLVHMLVQNIRLFSISLPEKQGQMVKILSNWPTVIFLESVALVVASTTLKLLFYFWKIAKNLPCMRSLPRLAENRSSRFPK